MKQNRCQESENYKLRDELMSDISALLVEQQLIESELSTLKRKEKKSYWYHRRRSSSTSDLDLSGSSYSGTSYDMFSPCVIASKLVLRTVSYSTAKSPVFVNQ